MKSLTISKKSDTYKSIAKAIDSHLRGIKLVSKFIDFFSETINFFKYEELFHNKILFCIQIYIDAVSINLKGELKIYIYIYI